MAGFYGADTEQLRDFGELVGTSTGRLSDIAARLAAQVNSVEWVGPDADDFRSDYAGRVNGLFDSATGLMGRFRQETGTHADEQDEASGTGDGSFLDELKDFFANPLVETAMTLKDTVMAGLKSLKAIAQGRNLAALAQALRSGDVAADAIAAMKSGMIDKAAGFLGKLGTVGRFAGGAFGLLGMYSGIKDMINPPHDGWRGVGDRAAGFLGAIGGAGSLAVMLGAGAALGPVGLGIVAGAGAVSALWTAGNAIYDNWDSITGVVSDFGGAVSDFASDAGDVLSGVGDFIGGLF